MIDIFDFYSSSFWGTIIIIICFLAVRFIIAKQSNYIKMMLWMFLLVRLLFPFSIHTDFGVLNSDAVTDGGYGILTNNISNIRQKAGYEDYKNILHQKPMIYTNLNNIFMIIWYVGIAFFVIYYLIQKILFYIMTRQAKKISLNEEIYEWNKNGACVIGVIKPRIYLPDDLDAIQQKFVLMHEKTHIKRNDYLVMMLYYIALALNWYNPLCWVSYLIVKQDIEMACDEQVLQYSAKIERQVYAKTLLQLCCKKEKYLLFMQSFGGGKRSLRKRIKNIGSKYIQKKSVYVTVAGLLFCILFIGFFLYSDKELQNISYKEINRIINKNKTMEFDDTLPQIGYVDKNKLIIYDNHGIYIYNLQLSKMEDYIDFKAHNFDGIQGDNATFVNVSNDGMCIEINNNSIFLQYHTKTKQIDNKKNEVNIWNPKIEWESIDNSDYYSVSDIYEIEKGEKCFLALKKNVIPNYGALIFVTSNKESEKRYSLFDI